MLENIEIVYEGGASKDTAYFPLDSLTHITENTTGYPEFSMFGELPAWGMYVRHTNGITMKNITIRSTKDDFRTAMIFDDVNNIQLEKIHIGSGKNLPIVLLNDTKKVILKDISLPVQNKEAIKYTGKK